MERLTTRREDGAIETKGQTWSNFEMCVVDCTRGNDKYDVRLAEYEDIGLTPEEVKELQRREKAAIEDMTNMANCMRQYNETSQGCCFACAFGDSNTDDLRECPGHETEECFMWRGLQETEAERRQKGPTAVKFLNDLESEIVGNDEIPEDERLISLSVYECCACHWRFFGDCERTGYGYTLEGTQTPNYCPMCGREINDCIEK